MEQNELQNIPILQLDGVPVAAGSVGTSQPTSSEPKGESEMGQPVIGENNAITDGSCVSALEAQPDAREIVAVKEESAHASAVETTPSEEVERSQQQPMEKPNSAQNLFGTEAPPEAEADGHVLVGDERFAVYGSALCLWHESQQCLVRNTACQHWSRHPTCSRDDTIEEPVGSTSLSSTENPVCLWPCLALAWRLV
jgi:hypothetical protein